MCRYARVLGRGIRNWVRILDVHINTATASTAPAGEGSSPSPWGERG